MKIALLGYGKMGKAIEAIALQRGHEIIAIIDPNEKGKETLLHEADAAIEFSQPEAAFGNIKLCLDKNVPVISGTTGWLDKKKEIDEYCIEKGGAFFYASNYSLGVNLFFRLNETLAKMMNSQPSYDVSIDEVHHTQKKDAPSGTAITLAEGIIDHLKRKKDWMSGETSDPDQLVINSSRVDPTPGTHRVKYTSQIDDIEIKHTAHSREGFAMGAVLVAEWIQGKKGVLGMRDFLQF